MIIKLSKNSIHKKILIVTAERVGDALFCTPAIHSLKQNLSHIQFDILAFSKTAASLFENNPDINQIFIAQNKKTSQELISQYSLVINFMPEMLKNIGTLPKQLITINIPDTSLHRAQSMLDFANSLLASPSNEKFGYIINPQPTDYKKIKAEFINNNINLEENILIGFQLGCHRVAGRWWRFWSKNRHQHPKVWPIENYIALANKIKQLNPKIKLIITGAETEKFLAKKFSQQVPWAIDFIGKTSLFELAALMDFLKAYVTHDTGSLHIACARNTSLVTLFGQTKAEFTGPYPIKENTKILQKNNVSDITVDEVYSTLQQLVSLV